MDNLIEQTVHSFLDLIEKRDSYTAGHSTRVAYYSMQFAKELNLPEKEIQDLYNAALLHDIGKIGIPDSILLKPGKLSIEEYRIMQEHVNIGFKTIKSMDFFSNLAYMIKDHHERFDGTGYPDGKKGDEISISSYILSLADSFDAITSSRIYSKNVSPSQAYEILKEEEGKVFPVGFVSLLKDVLLNQEIGTHREQKPENHIEQEKFAFHFKDTLTGVNSYSYLNFFLLENIKNRTHKNVYYIYTRNMTQYNKDNGWEEGDWFLKEFASFLKKQFNKSEIFRVKGDDFLIISKDYIEFDHDIIKKHKLIESSCLKVDLHHFNFFELNIDSVKKFENIIFNELTTQYRDETKKETIKILQDETKSYEEKVMQIDLDSIIKDFELFNELISAQDKEYRSLLHEKESLANKFFNLNINLQIVSDFEANIIEISQSCNSILGYTNHELENSSFLNLVHPDDIESTINEMKKLSKGEVVYHFENRFKKKDGDYIILAWSACANDSLDLIYASAHDITELRKKEEVLYQQSKTAVMGEMLENIAHQWKQPLSSIKVLASALELKNSLGILEKEDFSGMIEDINLTVDHLSHTVEDFRCFFNKTHTLTEFNISDTFKKVFTITNSVLKTANIDLIKNLSDIFIVGTESELMQVIINIINNAKDEFLSRNSHKNLLFINIQKDMDTCTIEILDNAGGISEKIKDKIFDSHFSTKKDKEGSGVGLYMSKLIIEEHFNGKLFVENSEYEFESNKYKGAKFNIIVPLKERVTIKPITWDDERMSIGIEKIDHQHKTLLELINKIYFLIRKKSSKKDIEYVLEKLAKYIKSHFRDEEKLFNEFNVDKEKIEKHIEEHKKFEDKISKLAYELKKSSNETEMLIDLFQFISSWFTNHVISGDRLMLKKFVKK